VKNRTVREFTEDCLSDGRTPEEILIVAGNTRWKSDMEEIKAIIKSFSGKLKKRFQIMEGNHDNKVKKQKN